MDEQIQPTNQQSNTTVYDSQGMANLSALQMRLNTRDALNNIEGFLRGYYITPVWVDKKNDFEMVKVPYAGGGVEPKMNDLGINTTMAYLNAIFNNQTVQSNLHEKRYMYIISSIHEFLADTLMYNQSGFNLKEGDYLMIVRTIINMLELFLTRGIDNKERESYAATIKTFESNSISQRKAGGLAGLFGGS